MGCDRGAKLASGLHLLAKRCSQSDGWSKVFDLKGYATLSDGLIRNDRNGEGDQDGRSFSNRNDRSAPSR